MQLWTSRSIISKQQLYLIQERVNSFIVPKEVGQIPQKIASSFLDFTADEWKNGTIIFSTPYLHDLLPEQDLKI